MKKRFPPRRKLHQSSKDHQHSDDYLGLLRTSANDAAQLVRKVYLTFLLVSGYLAILVGATTDEQLLRGTGAILPIIQVQLSIVAV